MDSTKRRLADLLAIEAKATTGVMPLNAWRDAGLEIVSEWSDDELEEIVTAAAKMAPLPQARRRRSLDTTQTRSQLAGLGISPRGLTLEQAAAYVGLSPNTFKTEVAAGRFPAPLPLGSERRLWDRRGLDRAMDRLSDIPDVQLIASNDERSPELVDAMTRAINAAF